MLTEFGKIFIFMLLAGIPTPGIIGKSRVSPMRLWKGVGAFAESGARG